MALDRPPHFSINHFHNNLFKGTIAVSSFGATITFQVVIQQIEADVNVSAHHTFHRKTARTFLAIAWLLFTVALGLACLAAIMMSLREDLGHRGRGRYESIVKGASGVLLALMLAAFLFCSLAVTAYCEGAGWTGVGMSAVFLALALCIWLFHVLTRREDLRLSRQLPHIKPNDEEIGMQEQQPPPPTQQMQKVSPPRTRISPPRPIPTVRYESTSPFRNGVAWKLPITAPSPPQDPFSPFSEHGTPTEPRNMF